MRRARPAKTRISAAALVAILAGTAPGGAQVVVAIDPGHGGIDPGAIAGDMVEKDIVLAIARRLAEHIDRTPGLQAHLVRGDDSFLTLRDRIRRARDAGAHVILSLHADTTGEGLAQGAHVYTLSQEGTDEAAIALAERENRADMIGGIALMGEPDDVASLVVELAQRGTADETEKLARALLESLTGAVPLLATDPHRQANFRILKAPEIPSVLVELGFMSNESDRARLRASDWRDRMAAALAWGIAAWAERASPGFIAPKR